MGKSSPEIMVSPHAVRRLAEEYRSSTGLPLLLVDPEGRQTWSAGSCALCRRLPVSRAREAACTAHRRTAVSESQRWGEPFISVCPFGIVTFAVPLSQDRQLKAGLVSGFCIFPQMSRDIGEEILKNARRLGVPSHLGAKARFHFRVVPSETLRRDAELLFDLTGKYGLNNLELFNESREKSIQQFTIANYLEDAREGREDLVATLASMQNEIIDKVVLGDLSGSREIVNRFLGVIFLESGMNFDMLKVRLLELIVVISRAAIGKGISADGLLGPRYSYLTDINAAGGFEDLCWKVTKVLENFTRTVSEEKGRKTWVHMTKMKDHIRKNFTAKITAEEVAAVAGLSVSRALHLFREETGMPLSGYVTRQRIEYAKYLIKKSDQSMAAIASECGFFDQSHFTKAFSAQEGISPLRYRNRIRQSEE